LRNEHHIFMSCSYFDLTPVSWVFRSFLTFRFAIRFSRCI
jgi:hypothetical protein